VRIWAQLGRQSHQVRQQLLPFQILAASVMAISIVGYAVSAAVLLERVGAEAVPIVYLFLGIVSIPVSIGFYWLIDRVPRTRLLQWVLVAAIALVLGWRLLFIWQGWGIGYGTYISLNVIDLILGVLFWTLVSDYFAPLQLERYTPLLVIAMTLGGLLAGGVVRLLTEVIHAEDLLLLVPLLCFVAISQVQQIQRRPSVTSEPEVQLNRDFLPNFANAVELIKRYPIVLLMAVQMAIAVLLWGLSERQFFAIYTQSFPQQEDLAGFLGILSAAFSVLEIGISYFIARPLLQHLGARQANLLYPLTTLLSFFILGLSASLPTAILLNLNYDALNNSFNQAVQTVNFSAIPKRFSGRARVVIDGILYPLFQAIAGLLLLVWQNLLTLPQLTLLGIFVSITFISVGYLTGRSYTRSMLTQLKVGSLDLAIAGEGFVQLTDEYATQVRQLLASTDPTAQVLGLDVAMRLTNPGQFLGEVQDLLLRSDPDVQEAIVQFLARGNQPEFQRYLRVQLVAEDERVRAAVLEALIVTQQPLSNTQLSFFLSDSSPLIRSLTCVAVWQAWNVVDPEIQMAFERSWAALNSSETEAIEIACLRMLKTIDRMSDRMYIPLVQKVLTKVDAASVQALGLTTLASVAQPTDKRLATPAAIALAHTDSSVRVAALRLVQVLSNEDLLSKALPCLADRSAAVRKQAAEAIASYGESALPLVQNYLTAKRQDVEAAAIATIGYIRTRRAEDLLWQHLQPQYELARLAWSWSQQVYPTSLPFQMLTAALQDFQTRMRRQVFYVLACLGYANVVNQVERALQAPDFAERQQAIVTLASLRHRRFVQPILPLLEAQAASELQRTPPPSTTSISEEMLHEMVERGDRWIRVGALSTLVASGAPIPAAGIVHPDPITQQAARNLATTLIQQQALEDLPLSRIFFLKRIALFEDIPLDELLIIDRNLKEINFLTHEVIFAEGTQGEELYIVLQGEVQILKRVRRKHLFAPESLITFNNQLYRELSRLQACQYFGDLTLFDEMPRAATAIAHTDCTLLALKRNSFQTLISEHPEIALRMCREMSLRLRETNRYLE